MSFHYKKVSKNKLEISRNALDIKLHEDIRKKNLRYTIKKLCGAHFLSQKEFILGNSHRWEIKIKGKMPKKSEVPEVQLMAVNGFADLGIFESFNEKYGADDKLLVTLVFDENFDPNVEALNYISEMEKWKNVLENQLDRKERFSQVLKHFIANDNCEISKQAAEGNTILSPSNQLKIEFMDELWEKSDCKKIPIIEQPKIKRKRARTMQDRLPGFDEICKTMNKAESFEEKANG